ncbi:methyl-accepting chemotaxis protein-1, serine sensor receptor [Noviherbaspirillum humi]|uniref:Methyl-accepting chemotaxis protein-1, serine sensor receptor n=1 Tax=Noviherbaspirillum humi TaxID=1688639 RepID=A0A239LKM0_9BURK|nr:methyl-accepting chemotaxis protein [Noviherbaspirillum humi]SNT30935.1 methyl-accepting chemotaxis protein-1, serine sensor receptor [Noviherbaspirillum humi]
MNLSRKLPLAFVSVSLIVALAGSIGIFQLDRTSANYTRIIEVDYENEQAVGTLLVDFKTQVQEWKNILLRGKDPKQLDKYWTAFQKREKSVGEGARKLHDALPAGESRDLIDRFAQAHRKMGEDYRKGFELFTHSDFDFAAADAAVNGKDRAPAELLDQARTRIVDATKEGVQEAHASAEQAMKVSIGLMALGFLGAAIGGVLLSRSITRPLREAVAVAEKVAQGDLTSRFGKLADDELGQLLAALQRMNGNLGSMVQRIRSSAETIANESSEIAAGNLDLSARTEQQASSLGETASSMEQLTATVKQNADNAEGANRVSVQTSNVAVKGGKVVAQVVEAMESIDSDAKRIADIVSVIEGIAFQTNILALNAAVEAARAGEQGRGFAVVAAEVRSLAQRSGAAAKEIEGLITASVETVSAGSRLVTEAGSTMEEVVASVQRVTGIMGDILTASREQGAGIEQVNHAVSEMEQVTQQNAALVEQAAAAARSMQEQAMQLTEAVSAFRV